MTKPHSDPIRGAKRTAIACAGLAVGMVGLAFASVPLYDAFCKATGYDGTPRQGPALASAARTDDSMVVHFDTNVAPGLPWKFAPEANTVEAKLGETKTVFFRVQNTGAKPSTGVATFNVQPGLMGSYFVKIACFCFNEQTLQPGETLDVPVVFYVDPAVREDSNTAHLSEMTLSYTYFASKNGQPVTASVATTGASGTKRDF
ncbi:Cytochrome c oxidase assembly protein CtaG [Methylobacterium mesophilicum]|jgi:cytochrome c oxidase assembly protein subunit 11|uniref:cytochrome c oxidase assembly protein n=1 Tax=Methylobacterium TaxID=407 RepID=UPI0011C84D0E|nr:MULTISPECIES: cytochrome c oxidase assembly protein [Methylobacterium]TXN48400.1 cytochrome c oxidase assembly protein [Methylobacterium sp. WL7]TXN74553.1 cytochrome c oxidase assembly protein [Methylobacterium sp. WL18]GJE19867.1 Cytochrome c oxidase assembly protein CtaG [Methylobacterium mesophilicum]